MELSLQQEEALRAAGLETLLDQQPKPQPASPEDPYVVPITHYEILFSHYSNTRLAAVAERKTAYCQTQVVRLVEDCSPEEVEPEYNQIVQSIAKRGVPPAAGLETDPLSKGPGSFGGTTAGISAAGRRSPFRRLLTKQSRRLQPKR